MCTQCVLTDGLAQIFNNEVDSYQSWTLFLIFVSIFVLISGVVLLTHKKPEPGPLSARSAAALGSVGFPLRQRGAARKGKGGKATKVKAVVDRDEEETMVDGEEEVLWRIGDASDESGEEDDEGQDEDVDHHQHPLYKGAAVLLNGGGSRQRLHGEEGEGLLPADEHEHQDDTAAPRPRRPSQTRL